MSEQPQEQREQTWDERRQELVEMLTDHLEGKRDDPVQSEQDKQRLAIMHITPSAVVQMASGAIRVSSPSLIPYDAEVVQVEWVSSKQMFAMVIRHESFDSVQVGSGVPSLPLLTFEAVTDGSD